MVSNIALAAEVSLFLSAISYSGALFTFVTDDIAGVIFLLAVEGVHNLVLNHILGAVFKNVVVVERVLFLFSPDEIAGVIGVRDRV